MHCCGCMITEAIGTMNGRSAIDELEEELNRVGARKDAYLAFVLKWDTSSDIDSWMVEPNGFAIGYNTPARGRVQGTRSYNYVLEEEVTTVDMNDPHLSPNKGNLDKDCISCAVPSIENLVYFEPTLMQDGLYQYKLDDYNGTHSAGFTVYIIERNQRLEPVGFAELRWDGAFAASQRQTRNAPTFIELHKSGSNISLKKVNSHLRIISTTGFNWI